MSRNFETDGTVQVGTWNLLLNPWQICEYKNKTCLTKSSKFVRKERRHI